MKHDPISASVLPKHIFNLIDTRGVDDQQSRSAAEKFVEHLSWNISDDLNELFFNDRAVSPMDCFNSRIWMSSWIETVAKDKNIAIKFLTGSVAGIVIIAMPLSIISGKFITSVQFVAQDVSDYNGIVVHRELAPLLSHQLMNKIFEQVGVLFPLVDCIDFRKCLLEKFSPLKSKVCWREDLEKSHLCTLSGDWEKDLSRFVGKSSRNSLKRKLKKLQAMGKVTFAEPKSQKHKEHAVEKLSKWKANQLKELGSSNIFAYGAFNNFLKSTVVKDNSGLVRLFGMYVDENPIALIHMLCLEKRWFLYQTAYTAREAGKYSPGYLLLLNVMEEACRNGVKIFDFGWGNEAYKLRFASQSLTLHHAFLPLTIKGHIVMLTRHATELTKKIVKYNIYFRSAATFALRVIGYIKKNKP